MLVYALMRLGGVCLVVEGSLSYVCQVLNKCYRTDNAVHRLDPEKHGSEAKAEAGINRKSRKIYFVWESVRTSESAIMSLLVSTDAD